MKQKPEMTEQEKELKPQGSCRFCGQTYFVADTVGGLTEEELNEEATMKCSCVDAKTYVRHQKRKKMVDSYVEETFSPNTQIIIHELIQAIEDYEIDKVTLKTPDGWTTTMNLDKDSYLTITRKATKIGNGLKA